MTNSDRNTGGSQGSKLDRRREKAKAARATADAAQQRLSGLDDGLAANTAQTRELEIALRRASDEVSRLKKALKASAKKNQQLTASGKKAAASVAKAQQEAYAAESKYDKAVLADMVRRERNRDLAAHEGASTRTASSSAKPTVGSSPERPVAATTKNTAARKTAAAAADPANRDPTGQVN
jgi:chromosome segregation ATPase